MAREVGDLHLPVAGVDKRPGRLQDGEGRIGPVHRPLAVQHTISEPLQRLQQQLVDRAEVIVNETVVLPGLPSKLPGRDPRGPLSDQQPLGGVEEATPGSGGGSGDGEVFEVGDAY
jgi:hypothetical protein